MAKFCGKCGTKLDEQGLCPVCNPQMPSKARTDRRSVNRAKKSKNKKAIIRGCLVGLIATFVIVLAIAMLAYWHVIDIPAISRLNKKLSLKEDFTTTIDVIVGKDASEMAYISDMASFSEDSYRIFEDDAINKKIAKEIKYSIEEVEIKQSNGTATVHFVAPDIYKILLNSLESGKTFSTTEDVIDYIIDMLNNEYPVIEQETILSFELINNHWYWEPSKDVLNILSGNLYQYFENFGYIGNGE